MKRDENQNVEYKESWHDKYLEWICGYANAKGGTLYIGIEDGTKKPVGVKNANTLMEVIPPMEWPTKKMLSRQMWYFSANSSVLQ